MTYPEINLLSQAKKGLPLSKMMAQLGLGAHAKKSARCPFHDDASASFSVYVGQDGEERFKCFAGCGQGDAIDFLARHRGLSNADACREFIRLAGVASESSSPARFDARPEAPFDWHACTVAFTPEHRRKLCEWRGYSPEFADWLHNQNLIGLVDGEQIAFPVHDPQGNVVGCHYRLTEDGSWRYHPVGIHAALFTIGDLPAAKTVFVFESQWDLFAVLAKLLHHIQALAGTAAIATRGASNARLLCGRLPAEALVYAFGQNDEAGRKWLAAVAAYSGCKTLQVSTPSCHKDANDWTLAGATAEEIRGAIAAAQPIDSGAPSTQVVAQESVLDDGGDMATAPQPFPIDLFPPVLGAMVAAVARCERVPVTLSAVCGLGVASAAIGAGLEVSSAADRTTRANLFVLAAAESGSGKSQVFRRIAQPVLDYQARLHDFFRDKTAPQLASEIGLITREIKRWEGKAAKTDDPTERERILAEIEYKRARLATLEHKNSPPCVICVDVTSEKLAVLLAGNRETMFSASPEARQIVDIVCGRYSSSKSTDDAIYLSGFSADFLRVDRLGRAPLTLRKPCLSVLWLVQPDAMARLFETETLAQSGFLPRFLTCHTQAIATKIEGERQGISESIKGQWFKLIGELLATYHDAEKSYQIAPTPEAKRLLDDFFNAVVDRRRSDLSDVGQFASRYGEQAWRVALSLHAALYGSEAHNHPLDQETAQNAIQIVQWFICAQLEVLARTRRQAVEKLDEEVLDLIESNRVRKGQDFTTSRDVQRARIVANAEAARTLLDRMETEGLLIGHDVTPPGGGKSTRIFRRVTNPVPE